MPGDGLSEYLDDDQEEQVDDDREPMVRNLGGGGGERGGKLLDSAAGKTCPSPSIDLRLVGDSASLLSSDDCCW